MLLGRLETPERITRLHIAIEELGRLGGWVQHPLGGETLRLADVADLIVLGRARIERPAKEEFGHDAAQRPHVDGLAERQTEDDLRGAVVATLQVRVADGLADVRRRAEIDNFDAVRLSNGIDQHYVLRFQIGVDQSQLLQFQQSCQHLQTTETNHSIQW